MGKVVLEINEVSKLYRLGEVGTGMLLEDMGRWVKKNLGRNVQEIEADENDRTKTGGKSAWALKDISFQVNQGDIIGLIGRNGAGKSTMLKILSRVTSPTSGNIKVKGKMASLLEVGTGFHPELTGRENIYLNAAILGMNRKEVNLKLDDIVEFAGVARYLDTPVKRYSSGMKVRLGFAVAAHLEPDILIVDEVLAVGDAEFQQKAIGKMQEVNQQGGRTVIYVSHNMSSIRKLCNKAIVFDRGRLTYQGNVQEAINIYFNQFSSEGDIFRPAVQLDAAKDHGPIGLKNAAIKSSNVTHSVIFPSIDSIEFDIDYEVRKPVVGMRMSFQVQAFDATALFSSTTHDIEPAEKQPGNYTLSVKIPGNLLNEGKYFICIRAGIPNEGEVLPNRRVIGFEVLKVTSQGSRSNEKFPGYLSPPLEMKIEKK
jgi:lipopolysaccharide transport system ATP-binding protein